jgi:NADP-dependent 3-hydroxy acid dehydrogenase YdfG
VRVDRDTRVLVTGASKGIGAALARAFAEREATVGLVARSESDAGSLPGEGHMALVADVTNPRSIAGAVERFGRVDVAVANAGVAHYQDFSELAPERAEQMTEINWAGTLHTVRAVLQAMLERRSGHIVVVSSGAGFRAFPQASVYGATKAAQRAFSDALRHELAGTGVSVTTVFPGEIESQLHAHERDTMPEWYKADEAAPAEELAKRVVDAVAEDKRFVHYPPAVLLLRIVHGISPRAADLVLRALRGRSVAPRP